MTHNTPDDAPAYDDLYAWEDDYDDLYLDDATYNNTDWDKLDPELVNLHDTILEMNLEQLKALNLGDLTDDVHRWAAARAYAHQEQLSAFLDLARGLLETTANKRSKLLSYEDIRLEYALVLGNEDIQAALQALESSKADPVSLARTRAMIHICHGEPSLGLPFMHDAITKHSADTPRLGLDFAEDLMNQGQFQAASDLLDLTRTQATTLGAEDIAHEADDLQVVCQQQIPKP